MTEDGVKALKYFSDAGIKTNCTLVFSVGQALLAAKAGATYVSPFYRPTGRQFNRWAGSD